MFLVAIFQCGIRHATHSVDGARVHQLQPVQRPLLRLVLRRPHVGDLHRGPAALLRLHRPGHPRDDSYPAAPGPAGGRPAGNLRVDGGMLARKPSATAQFQGASPTALQLGTRLAGQRSTTATTTRPERDQPRRPQPQHRQSAQQQRRKQHRIHARQQWPRWVPAAVRIFRGRGGAQFAGIQHEIRVEFSASSIDFAAAVLGQCPAVAASPIRRLRPRRTGSALSGIQTQHLIVSTSTNL